MIANLRQSQRWLRVDRKENSENEYNRVGWGHGHSNETIMKRNSVGGTFWGE